MDKLVKVFLCERILVEIPVKHLFLLRVQVTHDTHIHTMGIVAAGLLTADGVVAVAEQINETVLLMRAAHRPKKRDDRFGLVSSFFFLLIVCYTKNSGHLRNQS